MTKRQGIRIPEEVFGGQGLAVGDKVASGQKYPGAHLGASSSDGVPAGQNTPEIGLLLITMDYHHPSCPMYLLDTAEQTLELILFHSIPCSTKKNSVINILSL